jgi:hypothetical protein
MTLPKKIILYMTWDSPLQDSIPQVVASRKSFLS